MKSHHYSIVNTWTGNYGPGTQNYKSYERSYTIHTEGKPELAGSSDSNFRGDKSKYNPEELFIASISGCHLLWYLHLCTLEGVIVIDYTDRTTGIMKENKDGSGAFTEVTLHPKVIVSDLSMIEKAEALHTNANKMCFIANSCNFPILHKPEISIQLP
ncbi:MAG: OsmC family protein [Cyclobacteriaceae bacterium]